MAKQLELNPKDLFGEEAILTSLAGQEQLARPFEFTLTIVSEETNLTPDKVIGKPLGVQITREKGEPRDIHGYISSFAAGGIRTENEKKWRTYRVKIVPWLWFMTRASRCYLYLPEEETKTIKQVLEKLIERVGQYGHVAAQIDMDNAQILSKRKVEHCVQYRETDFNFFSRTLEKFGVYYYFKFTKNSHTVVLSDQRNYPNSLHGEVPFPKDSDAYSTENIITSWEHAYEFVTGKWEQNEYDFLNPSVDLKAKSDVKEHVTLENNTNYEHYDYPGEYISKDDGDAEAGIRLQEEASRFNTVVGTSNCHQFSPGYAFSLIEHPSCDAEKGLYLLTSVTHSATQPGPFTSDATPTNYSNCFTCMTSDGQFRPIRRTPQPLISGVQTAVVVGPPGEEIHTDAYGRVKVQFHWDREGQRIDKTSCWIRVSQVHAGKGFGGIDIPRVGEEVVVSFLEGDVDRPLITGRVYHKESMPPYTLPEKKMVSGMKSNSYKGGGGYNELFMDDTKGNEKINIHAQYDMATTVEHDDTQTILNDRTIHVVGKHTETIDKDTKIVVSQGNLLHMVNTGKAQYYIKSSLEETYDDKQTTNVKKDLTVVSTEGKIHVESSSKQITLLTGASQLVMKHDGTIELKGVSITIEGKQDITLNAPKIAINGKQEALMGVGSQVVKCDPAKVSVAGAMVTSAATGMHEISGALVKIN